MSDQMPPQGQTDLSEEELRQYLGELRQAPAAEIIAQVITMLANAAQVKLGRGDARVLIDTIEAVKGASASTLPDEFGQQIDELLGQLRMAQVEGEKEVARLQAEGGQAGQPGPAPSAPGSAPARQPDPDQSQQSPQDGGGSRLWTPGT